MPYGQSSVKLPVILSPSHSVIWSLGHLVTQSLGHLVTHVIQCCVKQTDNITIYKVCFADKKVTDYNV